MFNPLGFHASGNTRRIYFMYMRAFLVFLLLLPGCVDLPLTTKAGSQFEKEDFSFPSIGEQSFARSEELRERFQTMPENLAARIHAIVGYRNPEDVTVSGVTVGYLSACRSVTDQEFRKIIKNNLEMIELASTNYQMYGSGIPDLMLIEQKKMLFERSVKEGMLAVQNTAYAKAIQETHCSEVLNFMRKSIWDIAGDISS